MVNFRVPLLFFALVGLSSCDLQPTITALPDTVGEFISARYPALLADPYKEPEIYNSAAGDYDLYASPEIYGTWDASNDYVDYVDVDKETLEQTEVQEITVAEDVVEEPEVQPDETPDVAPEPEAVPEATPEPDDILVVSDYKLTQLNVAPRAADGTVVVRRGDTLYAIARANNMTVQELADINKLTSPYTLRIGQVLQLHAPVKQVVQVEEPKQNTVVSAKPAEPKPQPIEKKPDDIKQQDVKQKKDAAIVPAQKVDVRVPVKNITVARGDTLYSLSRQYSIPVNDLAVMNNLNPPFALSVGQNLRVPDLKTVVADKKTKTVDVAKPVPAPQKSNTQKPEQKKADTKPATTTNKPKQPAKVEQPKNLKIKTKPRAQTTETKVKSNQKTETKTATKQATQKKTQTPKIAARSSSKFTWPVRGTVLSHFGAKMGGLYNDGINISAKLDTPVRAAENGVVAYAGNEVRGMGNLVIIQHEGGWMTVYAHMNSMNVRRGARVDVGQKIGAVGQTGKVSKPQLHFEIRKGTKAYNPVDYLKK